MRSIIVVLLCAFTFQVHAQQQLWISSPNFLKPVPQAPQLRLNDNEAFMVRESSFVMPLFNEKAACPLSLSISLDENQRLDASILRNNLLGGFLENFKLGTYAPPSKASEPLIGVQGITAEIATVVSYSQTSSSDEGDRTLDLNLYEYTIEFFAPSSTKNGGLELISTFAPFCPPSGF